MEIVVTPHFKREAKRLPLHLRPQIQERLRIFQDNPFHPSLKTHKLHGEFHGFWSFSIDRRIRVIFEFTDGLAVFHSIGDHSIYD